MSETSTERTYPRGSVVAEPADEAQRSDPRLGVRGLTLVGIGAVLIVVALAVAPWFAQFPGSGRFADVHHFLTARPRIAGLALQYFTWLAPVLAVVVAALAVAANVPALRSESAAGLGAAAAGGSVAVTVLAIHLRNSSLPVYWTYLTHARAGFYLALVGFLVMAAGALVAPRR